MRVRAKVRGTNEMPVDEGEGSESGETTEASLYID
jgi:hypothetical protein